MEQLKNLYELLKKEYEPIHKDLSYNSPDENVEINTVFPEEKQFLSKSDTVCCEQKLIYWDGEHFLISCLYNNHPTLKYRTDKEVISFYKGYDSDDFRAIVDYGINDDLVNKAFSDGIYTAVFEMTQSYKRHFEESIAETISYN